MSAAPTEMDVDSTAAAAAAPASEVGDTEMQVGDPADEDDDEPSQQTSRKRKADEANVDTDANMDGGDEDEDDDSGRKPHKKHRKEKRPGGQFIDDIAVNEDDEDEPDYDEDEQENDDGDGEPDDGEDLTDERVIKEDQDEIAGDADDQQEEDERDVGIREKSKKHKKKHKHSKKSRGGDGGDDGGSEGGGYSSDEGMHQAMDNERDRVEMEKLAKQIEEKYQDQSYDSDYDEDAANRASSGAVLPSVRDPSLFILRVGKGENEADICLQLLQQFYKREADPDPARRLVICSVFTTPASKGYIYVEAFREVHVKEAIESLPKKRMVQYYAASKKSIKVPLTEMVAAIKFRTTPPTCQEKQWVRFKRGPNKDDLAQVVSIQDQGNLITVKFVPRLDFDFLEAKRANPDLTRQEWVASDIGKRARIRRSQQKYFQPNEMRSLGFQVEKKMGLGGNKNTAYYAFQQQKFKNGFQYRDIKIDALETDPGLVAPSPAEIDFFTQRLGADSDDEDLGADGVKAEAEAIELATQTALANTRKKIVYANQDRVVVIAGALRNVVGRIVSIQKDSLIIQPDNVDLVGTIEEPFAHVRKFFDQGAHVKVVSGIHKNETGMIAHVIQGELGAESKLAIVTDVAHRTIEVSSQDVVESSEVSGGRDTLGNYELYDLIQITNDVVGVIINVNISSFTVLTNTGSIQQIKLQEIQLKRNDRFSKTTDVNQESLSRDDVVYVVKGPLRGKKATIKHLFRRMLFCQSREVTDNNGNFVIRGDQVQLVGGGRSKPAVPRSPGAGARSPGPAPQSPRSSGMAGPAGARAGGFGGMRRDPIIGKDIKITGGPYKGHAGLVLDIMEGVARVELRSLFRKISVPRAQIMESETVHSRIASNPFYGSQTPLVGGATPAHVGLGGATPAYEGLGGMTPAHMGGRTPSHQTPGHDVWSARTPAHRQDFTRPVVEEEEEPEDEWQRQMGFDSSNAAITTPLNPSTPSVIPATPGGMTPLTPSLIGNNMETPQTPYMEPTHEEEEEEEEPHAVPSTPAAQPTVVSGYFTSDLFLGCYVTADGQVGVIQEVLEGGARVRIRHVTDRRVVTYDQSALSPIPPAANDLGLVLVGSKDHSVGQRVTIVSILGNEALVDEGDLLPLPNLCKCEPVEEAAAESSTTATKKKKVKSEKKKK